MKIAERTKERRRETYERLQEEKSYNVHDTKQ